ncbi:tol-pal system-associated acyl-CoA thioesterase [Halotalea alkalilenta]|uniref:4-hydroxybenzoyl-CoA thioesterase n=1 Tax=Halotalea alkalilenta TaxID=376489 RepID=A0A172YG24_9GAMM|nr:tol-pal system-associated acyl-CoA thioesterase [Halotalea alkalilenta]ANF58230.1 4-hydroxybenzoyl-CoA thioesterase [Halotalea alkalilenta]
MSAFSWPVTVYIEDTDAGAIVYHANYLKFMERARTEWLRLHGFTQQSLFGQGLQLVVRRLECRYLRPARLDDQLYVGVEVSAFGRCSLTFTQRICRVDELLGVAEVDIACIDVRTLKPSRWPEPLRAVLEEAPCG